MIERALQLVAPHPCCGCGKVGALLCVDCKNDIICEPFTGCIWCGGAFCDECIPYASKVWVVGVRQGTIGRAIDLYKFQRAKGAVRALAELLDHRLPLLPLDTLVTSVPTVPGHIRARGYDHAALLAREFAARRKLVYAPLLRRTKRFTQHKTKSREIRAQQATGAFLLAKGADTYKESPVLLIEDVITTGATVKSAAQALAPLGGAIFVGALAYQAPQD